MDKQTILVVAKAVFLFLAIRWSIINVMKNGRREAVPRWNFILQALGITGFVVLQWLI